MILWNSRSRIPRSDRDCVMKYLQNPEQELRFTRASQAMPFWLASAVLSMAGVTLLVTSSYRSANPELPHPLWAVLPLLLAFACARLAFRLTRHAYLILTPLGVEIFPFFRPQMNMQSIYWQQIADIDCSPSMACLTLHFDREHSSGIHLSLRPIPQQRRGLLLRALRERVSGEPPKGAVDESGS